MEAANSGPGRARAAAFARRARRRLGLEARTDPVRLVLTEEDRRYMKSTYDPASVLPAGAAKELNSANPRLQALRGSYSELGPPATGGSVWKQELLDVYLDLRWFRGDSLITWHYRDLLRVSRLKFFVFANYVLERVGADLLRELGEDGAFGCWTYDYEGYPTVSRDLLDSAIEIHFLESHLGLSSLDSFSVLDIGAGYGRLGHRMTQHYPNLGDYCCVDAVAESTFLSEYYFRYRGCEPKARAVPLGEIEGSLEPGSFDLALNIHSFSECPMESIEAWVDLLVKLRVPRLLIIPNEPEELLSYEPGGARRDFGGLLEAAGYELVIKEPVLADPAVADLVGVRDYFHLYALGDAGLDRGPWEQV